MKSGTWKHGCRQCCPVLYRTLPPLSATLRSRFPGYPSGPVHAAAEATLALLKRSGLSSARLMEIPGGYPAVFGEVPAPAGAPTVLLYAHYDVQPGKKEDGWETDPFEPVIKDGRLFGRGAADDKSGVVIIAAALSLFSGRPPVGVKVVIEGEEETEGHLEEFIAGPPGYFLLRCVRDPR